MQVRKTYLFAFSILSVFLFLGLFFLGNPDEDPSYRRFAEGQYEQSFRELQRVRSAMSASEYHLIMAYIARGRGDLQDSNQRLAKALEVKHSGLKPKILAEIYLNQALNAYLVGDRKAIISSLKGVPLNSSLQRAWVKFFEGTAHFLAEDYEAALKDWEKPLHEEYLSPWMQQAFGAIFTPLWYDLRHARIDIEMGKGVEALRLLQEKLPLASSRDQEEIHLLTGLYYVQLGQGKSQDAEIAYHKVALSYFSKLPLFPNNLKWMRKDALYLLQKKAHQDLGLYIAALENWHADEILQELSLKMSSELKKEISANQEYGTSHLLVLWNQVIGNGELRRSLRQQFENTIFDDLDSGNFPKNWNIVLFLSQHPQKTSEEFASLIGGKILELLPQDNEKLERSLPYLEFWSALEKDHRRRLRFAENLVFLSKRVWMQEQQEEKALRMMRAADSLPFLTDKRELNQELETTLSQIYKSALLADNVDSLPYILRAVKEFNIKEIPIEDQNEIVNHLADAQYLYSDKRYGEAIQKALWVLQIQPDNAEAHWIVGMSHYHMGNHAATINRIQNFAEEDIETAKAFAISHLLAGDESRGIQALSNLEKRSALTKEDYLKLALGLLNNDKESESIAWFEKINPVTNESRAGLAYAYYRLKQWQKALHYFLELEAPYTKIEGLQGIAVEAYAALGQIDKAEEILANLLKQNRSEESELSFFFRQFKRKKLDQIDRHYIAGKFYSQVQHRHSQALYYFEQIQNPTSEMLFEKAVLLQMIGRTQDAIVSLERALLYDNEEISPLYLKILPLLAKLSAADKQYVKAIKYYEKAIEFSRGGPSVQAEYASDLFSIQLQYAKSLLGTDQKPNSSKVDEAFTILDRLAKEHPAIPEILYLKGRSLYMMDNAVAAEKVLLQTLDLDLSNANALKLLGLIYRDQNHLEKAIQMAKEALRYTPDDAEAYEELASVQEKEDHLLDAITNLEQAIKFQPDRLSAYLKLAQLYLQIHNPLDALLTCECALEYAPDDPALLKLLVKILNDPDLRRQAKNIGDLEERRHHYQEQLKNE